MSHTEHSPLARLVLFMVCLSVFGIIVAGALAVFERPPGAVVPQTPKNTFVSSTCLNMCNYNSVLCEADLPADSLDRGQCYRTLTSCTNRCICSDCQDTCNNAFTACRSQSKNPENDRCDGLYDLCTAGCSC